MQCVTIVPNERYLKRYLAGLKDTGSEPDKGFWARDGRLKAAGLLQEKGFRRIRLNDTGAVDPAVFIQEYNRLIERLAAANHGRAWLASDIASKNQFSSQLPLLLEEFVGILILFKKKSFRHVLLIGLSPEILESLKIGLQKDGVPVEWAGPCPSGPLIGSGLRKMAGVFFHALRLAARGWYARLLLKDVFKSRVLPGQPYYVIRTFVYDHSFLSGGRYQDSFFGRLPEFLAKKKPILVLANVLGRYRFCIGEMRRFAQYPILPFEFFLSVKDIVAAVAGIFSFRWRIPRPLEFMGYDVSAVVSRVDQRTFKGVRIYHFLHYWAVKNLVRRMAVDEFLLTYENYPWERMTISALREFAPNVKITAYQHTVTPQAFLNFFPGRHERKWMPFPDRIITTGDIPLRILQTYGCYAGVELDTGCGLRFEYLSRLPAADGRRRPIRHILIPLEADLGVFPMVAYVLGELGRDPRYQIRVRTHPFLPWERFAEKYGDPGPVEISRSSLAEDLHWADLVVYWSTTVSLEALLAGKPVIHFQRETILSFDPLLTCSHLKWVVSSGESLPRLIDKIEAIGPEEWNRQQEKAREYIRGYFYPVREEDLQKFIGRE